MKLMKLGILLQKSGNRNESYCIDKIHMKNNSFPHIGVIYVHIQRGDVIVLFKLLIQYHLSSFSQSWLSSIQQSEPLTELDLR